MVSRDLKREIRDNAFASRLGRMQFDREEYARLCEALRELAGRWRGEDLVDRETAGTLCSILGAAREIVPAFGKTHPGMRDEMEDVRMRLDALVRGCFGGEA